jgi:hypothetical protein
MHMNNYRNLRSIFVLPVFMLFIASFSGYSQEKKNISEPYPKLMIIPYPQSGFQSDYDIYFNFDGMSGKNQANSLIRGSVDRALFDNLLLYFDISRIHFYKTPQTAKDLDYIYYSIAYVPKKQRLRAIYRNFPNFTVFQILTSGKNRWGVNCMNEGDVIPVVKNPKIYYNDLLINNKDLIPYLNESYKCDYYLFINGVEIKTRFKVCMNLMQNVYQKDLLLHFTLVNHKGEKVTGGIVGITYEPSKHNDVYELVEKNVGILAGMVEMVIKDELKLGLRYDPL